MAGEEGIVFVAQAPKMPRMSTADIPFDPRCNKIKRAPKDSSYLGWGGGDRTPECMDQNHVPYHLATPHRFMKNRGNYSKITSNTQ